jgi:hypothetical protein
MRLRFEWHRSIVQQQMKRRSFSAIEIEAIVIGALTIWALVTGLYGMVGG